MDACRPVGRPLQHQPRWGDPILRLPVRRPLTNPVKDSLIERASAWPGITSLDSTLHDTPLVATRPTHFFRHDGPMPESAHLSFHRPPGFESLAFTEFAARISTRFTPSIAPQPLSAAAPERAYSVRAPSSRRDGTTVPAQQGLDAAPLAACQTRGFNAASTSASAEVPPRPVRCWGRRPFCRGCRPVRRDGGALSLFGRPEVLPSAPQGVLALGER
jgi:hypothetical protein